MDKIPWDDPDFSARMLVEHLSQAHDAASRRLERIRRQVAFIHRSVLGGNPARILDLGCGPGLYTEQFAALGHTCVGIDFSPASVGHARLTAEERGSGCTYHLGDIRYVEYGRGFDLVMLIFGEINVFRRSDAQSILAKARAALRPGGRVLLEAHTWDAVRGMGGEPPTWTTRSHGLYSVQPYLVLHESFWNAEHGAAVQRHYVIDAATAEVRRYGQSIQAYDDAGYAALLESSGLRLADRYPSLTGAEEDDGDFVVMVAHPASSRPLPRSSQDRAARLAGEHAGMRTGSGSGLLPLVRRLQ
ncbi:MAG: class I SAM-dependent methyltransferase [Chloroflexi bacterium]|nr:MAG: class I SAM-dependent methyltransferase [Chloroflexota bacterium]